MDVSEIEKKFTRKEWTTISMGEKEFPYSVTGLIDSIILDATVRAYKGMKTPLPEVTRLVKKHAQTFRLTRANKDRLMTLVLAFDDAKRQEALIREDFDEMLARKMWWEIRSFPGAVKLNPEDPYGDMEPHIDWEVYHAHLLHDPPI